MDPQAAWEALLAAYAEGDYESASEHASSLLEWLNRGGFPPIVLGDQELGLDFERTLAHAGCTFVLETFSTRWATTNAHDQREEYT